MGGRRSGVKKFALGGVARGNCASRSGARAVGLHARCVEAARRLRRAIPVAGGLGGRQNRGGGGSDRRGEEGRRHEERSGTRENQGSLAAH